LNPSTAKKSTNETPPPTTKIKPAFDTEKSDYQALVSSLGVLL
jgi:hypothetical protein